MNPDGLPSVGDTLVGKYRLTRKLGQGGMGAVFEATHLKLGQRVAIKLVLPQVAQRPELAYRFEHEGRAAAKLRGPHAARVSDVDVTPEGLPFLVMEFLEGHSLLDELKRRGPLPIAEAVGYVREACEGVDEAHRAGIIHRDLKPANLFLSVEGDRRIVKVVDFGIAKTSDAGDTGYHTATDVPLGTYKYMSPEQANSARSVDTRTDVWSLGVVLYQLLSGQTPFHAEGVLGVMYAIANQAPPPLGASRDDVPAALVAVIERALAKKREDRYQTVRELSDALAPFAAEPEAPPSRPYPLLPLPSALPPPPSHRPQTASEGVPNDSITSGSKSHVVPIVPAALPQGFLAVPRWFVVGSVAVLFGSSAALGVGVVRLGTNANTVFSQKAPQGLNALPTTSPALPTSPPAASEQARLSVTAAPFEEQDPSPTEVRPGAGGAGNDARAAVSAGTASAISAAPATRPSSSKARPSKAAGEPAAREPAPTAASAPAPKVLSEGEIFE